MITRRSVLCWGGLALVLGVVNVEVIKKEQLRRTGRPILLALAPLDPRSLIAGDYMNLTYAVARDAADRFAASGGNPPRRGTLVVTVDSNGVASFARLAHEKESLAGNETRLRFYTRGRQLMVGPDAFHFQEGHAQHYERARFADVRVDERGEVALLGLLDADRRPLPGPGNPTE